MRNDLGRGLPRKSLIVNELRTFLDTKKALCHEQNTLFDTIIFVTFI